MGSAEGDGEEASSAIKAADATEHAEGHSGVLYAAAAPTMLDARCLIVLFASNSLACCSACGAKYEIRQSLSVHVLIPAWYFAAKVVVAGACFMPAMQARHSSRRLVP